MRDIRFEFEGKTYTAPAGFYDTSLAILPDGRTVTATGWLESLPPKPTGIKLVPTVKAIEADPKKAG